MASRYHDVLEQYDLISEGKPGWNLTELRALSPRERRFWVEIVKQRFQHASRT